MPITVAIYPSNLFKMIFIIPSFLYIIELFSFLGNNLVSNLKIEHWNPLYLKSFKINFLNYFRNNYFVKTLLL